MRENSYYKTVIKFYKLKIIKLSKNNYNLTWLYNINLGYFICIMRYLKTCLKVAQVEVRLLLDLFLENFGAPITFPVKLPFPCSISSEAFKLHCRPFKASWSIPSHCCFEHWLLAIDSVGKSTARRFRPYPT